MTLKTLNNTDVVSNMWIVFKEGEHFIYDKGWRILVLQPLFLIIFVYEGWGSIKREGGIEQ